MSGHYDVLWKGLIEEVWEDLLRFVFPDAEQDLDLKRGVVFLDKELNEMYPEPEKAASTRVVDKLAKVYLKNGDERWMLLHLEIEGSNKSGFAKRMFTYYYRILDRYSQPVAAVALLTGRYGKNMPDRCEHHFMGTHMIYQYNTLCLTDFADDVLAASNNPFAVVLLVAKMRLSKLLAAQTEEGFDRELLRQKVLIVKLLQEKVLFGERKIAVIISFLNNYIQFKKTETNHIFMEQLDNITGKKNTMGYFEQLAEIKAQEAREEAREQGEENVRLARIEEQEKAVKAFLNNTEFSVDKIASLVGVSVSFVERIKNSLVKK